MNEVVNTAHLELPHEWDVSQQKVRLWPGKTNPLKVLQWFIDEPDSTGRGGGV